MLDALVDAAIPAREDHLGGAVEHPGLLEEGPQRRPGPLRVPDRVVEPGHVDRPGPRERPPVARALQRDRGGHPLAALEVRERQRHRPADEPPDLEAIGRCVERRDVEVDQQVVQADRRDRVPQGLQRHAVVAEGEVRLLEGDLALRIRGRHLGGTVRARPRSDQGCSARSTVQRRAASRELLGDRRTRSRPPGQRRNGSCLKHRGVPANVTEAPAKERFHLGACERPCAQRSTAPR